MKLLGLKGCVKRMLCKKNVKRKSVKRKKEKKREGCVKRKNRFFQKYLHSSRKSSTFAADFRLNHIRMV